MPTIPLSSEAAGNSDTSKEYDVVDVDGGNGSGGENGPPYTPLTIALQGTLQLSHLHIWTDMNVLMHRLSSAESPRKEEITLKKQKQRSTKAPGYVVAGTAYSLPELHSQAIVEEKHSETEEDAAIIENARNPWTSGHGSKVVRGEPLTLKFRVSWVSGADSLGWLDHDYPLAHEGTTVLGVFTKLVFFVMAAGIGALFASYYQRVVRRGGGGWRGDGILGRPVLTKGGSTSGVSYGNSGRSNGYGGFSSHGAAATATTSANGGGYGYGGYGKKD